MYLPMGNLILKLIIILLRFGEGEKAKNTFLVFFCNKQTLFVTVITIARQLQLLKAYSISRFHEYHFCVLFVLFSSFVINKLILIILYL